MSEIKGTAQEGLFGATLGFFIGFAAVALFGPTAKEFKTVMDLSPALLGLLVAAPNLSGSLLRIPFSAWVDTTGGRKPFMALLLASIVGMSGLTFIVYQYYPDNLTRDLYPLILLFGVLSGCGIATFSVGISQVSYWFPQSRQGGALGTYAGVGNLAPGIFTMIIGFALAYLGLAGSYLAWLVFLAVGTALYFKSGKNAWYFQLLGQGKAPEQAREIAASEYGQEIFPVGTVIESLTISAKVWRTWMLVLIYFTTFGGFLALTGWLPTYWSSFFGFSLKKAVLLTATYSILASVVRIYGGAISDKFGGEKTAIIALSAMLVGAVLMTISHNLALSIAGEILLGVGMGVTNAAVFKILPGAVSKAVGGAAGWVGGLGAFGGFAVPPILGLFVDKMGDSGYATGFVTFILLAMMSMGVVFILKSAEEN